MTPTAMDGADRFTSPDYTAQAPALRQDTVELLAAVTQAATQPVAVFTGGQPGAGKTRSIVEPLEKRFAQEGGIAVIDPDLLRPLFARAQEEMRTTGVFSDEAYRAAGTLAYDVSLGLADQSRNVLRDGTLASTRYPLMEIDQLHERGYRVEVHVAAVYEGLSRARTVERREREAVLSETGFGRDVPPAFHDQAVTGVAASVATLWDNPKIARMVIYDRSGDVMIDRTRAADGRWLTPEGRPHDGPEPKALVERQQREPTPQDLVEAAGTWVRARENLHNPARRVPPTEVAITEVARETLVALAKVAQNPQARVLAAADERVGPALKAAAQKPLQAAAEAWLRDPKQAEALWPEHRHVMGYANEAVSAVLRVRLRHEPKTTEHQVRTTIADAMASKSLVSAERLQEWAQARQAQQAPVSTKERAGPRQRELER